MFQIKAHVFSQVTGGHSRPFDFKENCVLTCVDTIWVILKLKFEAKKLKHEAMKNSSVQKILMPDACIAYTYVKLEWKFPIW